ncbi:NACHT, LRR and PYD domains-containing protein 1a allele 5-like [Hyperolius riggenbachi]|uniref:NACHT, LRR and PYD domains-containing protein 1a allele 5-like n=1 Tax=Hyperolius riggenbachi TaxID=752182 RepID=UPI0035A28EC6
MVIAYCNMAGRILFGTNPADLLKALERDAESSRRHFVDEHSDTLMDEIEEVEPILKDLLEEDLLSDEEYNKIQKKRSPQEKMRQLYFCALMWDNEDKDVLLDILKKHNGSLIARLQGGVYNPEAPLLVDEGLPLGPRTLDRPFSSNSDEKDCDLCGKNYDPADVLVVPYMTGNMFRLELRSAGLFRCTETGIKFQVTQPTVIEYKVEHWNDYIKYIQSKGPEVLGPLFSIKTPKPNTVSAVYLPHYLCLKELGGDTSWIKCAHFKDGDVRVETPAKILPFHVVLENPSFSALGVFCWNLLPGAVARYIPLHGKVLLYFRIAGMKNMEYKIHLYLIPGFAPINKEFDHEKNKYGFKRIDKPPRTKAVYTKKDYTVTSSVKASINPEELEVQSVSPLDNYTEITINAKEKIIDLSLSQEDSEGKVWGCRLSKGEIEELQSNVLRSTKFRDVPAITRKGEKHFVDRHREALISRVSLVSPILDSLLSDLLLTHEQYDTVRKQMTPQDQMRVLYSYSRGWGDRDKDIFYKALQKNNAPLMQDLSTI